MSKTKKIAGLCLILGMTVSFFVSCKPKETAEKKDDAVSAFAVNTQIVAAGNLDDYLEFGGNIQALSVVNVLPDTAGKISRLTAAVGDSVYKNQVIAYVDPSRPGMTYSDSPVKVPVAGTITSLPYSVGQPVSPSAPIAQISSINDLELTISVAERFVSRVKVGQKADVTFDAIPGETFSASVYEISPILDLSTRTMAVKLHLLSRDKRIKAGMYARVRLVTEHLSNAIVIPYDAIVMRNGVPYVFTIKRSEGVVSDTAPAQRKTDTKEKDAAASTEKKEPQTIYPVHLHSVQLGIHVDDRIEITDGLKAGDEIIVRGQTLLSDGMKVNIVSEVE